MNKINTIGIIVSLIGLIMMGYEMGSSSITGEGNEILHFGGLFIVFVGAFIVVTFTKKKTKKQ